MKYRYHARCQFCYGDDYPICEDDGPSEETFDTALAARKAAEVYVAGYSHLEFSVIDENGNEVEEDEASNDDHQ